MTAGEQRADGFPSLREPALGGPDTASRVRVVWQVKLASVGSKACGGVHAAAVADGKAAGQRSACRRGDERLPGPDERRIPSARKPVVSGRSRVGHGCQVDFKWSRDNASTASKVKSSDQNAATIVVEDAGHDDVIGFAAAKYVELSDESQTLNGQAGLLLEVEAVSGTSIRVKNPANASLALGTNPMLRRWDGVGDVTATRRWSSRMASRSSSTAARSRSAITG